MTEYGKYLCTDSVVAIYKNGKLKHVIERVNPETLFIHEDYHKEGIHCISFEYLENDTKLEASVEMRPCNSFAIYPSWMTEKLKENL